MNRLIIYGDIHGCYNEFKTLREQIDPQNNDIEVCVGDIITKGKDSIQTLRYIQEHNIKSVLGNHEEKIIRYLKHEKLSKNNPITLDIDEQNIVDRLTVKDIAYLKSLPIYMKFKNLVIVHSGLQNEMTLDNLSKREKQKVLRLRYLDKEGHFVQYGKETNESIFWADVYDGNQGFVVYGHQHLDEPKINTYALGIDTGCVYENKLSAAIFTLNDSLSYDIVSVQSSLNYFT